ncbi:hypothetical protein A7U60_g1317 [Sanghuangporus baumii]|uniref:NACHT domain-containing protein n=1 Tax=Sanghuangporus baumii TaxID=108892 RepID=A0A9Q5I4N3_SANBA|nr:hypothetical protein A7U60_g1317 [Sanghuangporus baumii]
MTIALALSPAALHPHHGRKDAGFQEAIDQYIKSIKDGEFRRKEEEFLKACRDEGGRITPQDIQKRIEFQIDIKSQNSGGFRRRVSEWLKNACIIIKDYEGVLNTFVSIQPNPAAIVWGAVSIVTNCIDRNHKLFEMIVDKLESFKHLVDRIIQYKHLYAEWKEMQNFVYKFKQLLASSNSISIKELEQISNDVLKVGREIEKTAEMIRETEGRCKEIQSWLDPKLSDKHEKNTGRYKRETPSSFIKDCTFSSWYDEKTCSVLWLYAPPGSGKSILCSRIIEHIKETKPHVPVIYHFYQFDQENSPLKTLQHLAYQLFRRFCQDRKHHNLEESLPSTWGERSPTAIQRFISVLVESYHQVYFIVDGLDEECRTQKSDSEAKSVVDFLIDIHMQHRDIVRILCSSRDRSSMRERFSNFTIVNVAQHLTEDMTSYLRCVIPGIISVVGQNSQQVVEKLCERAAGNFLLASFMIRELKKPGLSQREIEDIAEGRSKDLKSTLDEYYKRAFRRFKERQRLTREVFSLIAFARRPLTVNELSEAIGMLRSGHASSRDLDNREIPKLNSSDMQEMFSPLIEVEKSCDHEAHHVCRLLHSTVLDFLQRHPDVLHCGDKGDPNEAITQSWIAKACMLYLGQARFSDFLSKRGDDWVDRTEKSVDNHHFLTYSAKYWYKHLDGIQDESEREQWTARIIEFIESPNFKTCIQVQSLWVDAQFGNFRDPQGFSHFRRAFPDWFMESKAGQQTARCYNRFLYDWQHFLISSFGIVVRSYAGELDRCWWTALDPHNFLTRSKARSRYINFRLQADDSDIVLGPRERFSGISMSGKELKVLQLKRHDQNRLEFDCEHWDVSGDTPMFRKQVICTEEASTNWMLYKKLLNHDSSIQTPSGGTQAAFSHDCRHLRIGNQIFSQNVQGDFVPISGLSSENKQHPIHVEEFSSRGSFIVLATRKRIPATSPLELRRKISVDNDTKPNLDCLEAPRNELKISNFFQCRVHECILRCRLVSLFISGSDHRNDREANYTPIQLPDLNENIDSTEGSSMESDDEASETWSECTSVRSEDVVSEEEESVVLSDTDGNRELSGSPSSQSSEEESSTDEDSESENHPHVSRGPESTQESDSEDEDSDSGESRQSITSDESDSEGENMSSAVSTESADEEGSDSEFILPVNSSDESIFDPVLPDRRRGVEPQERRDYAQKASIIILDTSAGIPTRLFFHKQKVSRPLIDSPPVIHPSAPLAVWPVSNGDILFADFQANTYFIRHLRPSTYNARHISMKCHFSDCGRYLHIASFEMHVPFGPAHASDELPLVGRALLVSSFRLCARQMTKSTPTLVHRVRINLTEAAMSVATHLPYTLTWTPRELYLTCSSTALTIYKISLFHPKPTELEHGHAVLKPQRKIPLPGSAQSRAVYYFPHTNERKASKILIGCEKVQSDTLRAHESKGLLPPVGCLLDEEKDLGGWTEEDDMLINFSHLRIGDLDRRMEKFNPEDDCEDLTPFYI